MSYPTRIRYGLRLLVRLAGQRQKSYVSIADIAAEENVSIKYLEQIVGLLKPLGILSSIRGAHGGYILTRSPSEVTLESIFENLGGLAASVPCIDAPEECTRIPVCATRPFWREFDQHTRSFLRARTLADLLPGVSNSKECIEFQIVPIQELSSLPTGCVGLTTPPQGRKQKTL